MHFQGKALQDRISHRMHQTIEGDDNNNHSNEKQRAQSANRYNSVDKHLENLPWSAHRRITINITRAMKIARVATTPIIAGCISYKTEPPMQSIIERTVRAIIATIHQTLSSAHFRIWIFLSSSNLVSVIVRAGFPLRETGT